MKEVKHYICEVCGTEYKEKTVCQQCEKGHKRPVAIVDAKFVAIKQNEKGLPSSIEVKFDDGLTYIYKR
jgi:hypothetical protein